MTSRQNLPPGVNVQPSPSINTHFDFERSLESTGEEPSKGSDDGGEQRHGNGVKHYRICCQCLPFNANLNAEDHTALKCCNLVYYYYYYYYYMTLLQLKVE